MSDVGPASPAASATRASSAEPIGVRVHRSVRRVRSLVPHVYIWICLVVFVAPFTALLLHALTGSADTNAVETFQYVVDTFGTNLWWSLQVTVLTLIIDLAICLPASYALVRYHVRGQRTIFALLTLPVYVPAAVLGMALLLTFTFTYHATSFWGLVLAMVIGSFPLMLVPLVVSMRDLPEVFEEAAACLGATRLQAYRRVVLPLLGPGISAGLLLVFIIVFNEYLVTLFVAPPGVVTAPLRVFNLVRTAGLAPTTAALAVTMQIISFLSVILFFRLFGTRHLKGTYLV